MPIASIKKAFTWTVVAATILWALGAATILTLPANAAVAGDLIKMDGLSSVYYLGDDSKRYVFPHEKDFLTHFNDFSGVTTVSQSELESYSIGGNVCHREGTYMVKITTDPKVYAVEPGCVLRHVDSEARALKLFGPNWNKMIHDVSDAFFVNYSIGSPLSSDLHPEGTLIKYDGDTTVYRVTDGNRRPVADNAAFSANRFQDTFVRTTDISYPDGSSITGAESAFITVAGPGVTPPGVGTAGSLTVSLASDTPASSTVVGGALAIPFTKVTFTASPDGDAVIDSMTVTRTGLSQNGNFSDIILLGANGRQTGNEKSLTSNDTAVFNDDLTIPAGTSKSYTIAANMAAVANINQGEVARLELTSLALKGSTSVVGSLPVAGNPMTMNNSITIGTNTVTNGSGNPTAATKEVGTNNYVLAGIKLSANSTEEQTVESILFTNNGTAGDSDVANLKLIVDGATIATASQATNKEIFFDLSASPVKLGKGLNKEFEVRGDIVGGSGRTVILDIEDKSHIRIKGKTYGFFINPTYPHTDPVVDNSSSGYNAVTTISTGKLSVSKSSLANTDVPEGATQVVLGAFNLRGQGEDVSVTRLGILVRIVGTEPSTTGAVATTSDVTNVTVYDNNGTAVAGPVDPVFKFSSVLTSSGVATSTDTFTVPPGDNVYTVKGDLSTDFQASDTIRLEITAGSNITAKGVTTNNTITATPSTAVTADTMTVKAGALAVSTSADPTAQTVVAGTQNFLFANVVLDATDSGEDVKVTQIKIDQATGAAAIATDVREVQLYDTSKTSESNCTAAYGSSAQWNAFGCGLLPTVDPDATAAGTDDDVTFNLSPAIRVPKGMSIKIAARGDISASAQTGATATHAFGVNNANYVSAIGADTAVTITETITTSAGQAMTVNASGTLNLFNDGANPNIGLILGGKKTAVGIFKAEAKYEDVKITKLGFKEDGSNQNQIDTVYVSDGTSEWSVPFTGADATVTTDILVTAGGSKTLTVSILPELVGTNFVGTSGTAISLAIDNVGSTTVVGNIEAKGISSGTTLYSASLTKGATFGDQYLFKTKPTVTKVGLSSVSNGSRVPLYKFTVAADSFGDVLFYKATFDVTTTSATVTEFELFENPGGSEINLTDDRVRVVDEIITASSGGTGGKYRLNVLFDADDTTTTPPASNSLGANTNSAATSGEHRTISAGTSKTYQLTGSVANGTSGSSSLQSQMIGDNANVTVSYAGTEEGTAGVDDANAFDNFIWSDSNYGLNSTTATQTKQWYNGYKTVATTSESLSF
jgi:hypothetical protein